MSIDVTKLMRLQSWLSPAFPIGAYSYSHGLERAFEAGAVRDRATLVDWLDADLRHGAGRADGIVFAQVWRAVHGGDADDSQGHLSASHRHPRASGDPVLRSDSGVYWVPACAGMTSEIAQIPSETIANSRIVFASTSPGTETADDRHILAIAELAAAMRGTSELALESGQQGVAFLGAVRKAWADPRLDALALALQRAGITPVLPVAAGMACAVHGIALEISLPLYLHAGVANLINAAVRLIPLGQSDGQLALATLETAVAETADEALRSSLAEIGSAAFMIDIASMQHETQYTRLFRS